MDIKHALESASQVIEQMLVDLWDTLKRPASFGLGLICTSTALIFLWNNFGLSIINLQSFSVFDGVKMALHLIILTCGGHLIGYSGYWRFKKMPDAVPAINVVPLHPTR